MLDPNVLVSATLSSKGSPALLIRCWLGGEFELMVSPLLIGELERVLAYPKITDRLGSENSDALLRLLADQARMEPDPIERSAIKVDDPGDEYLIDLAVSTGAALVSGDRHLKDLAGALPVFSPAAFVQELERSE